MEHKVGETFDLDGVKLKVEKANNDPCEGCYFKNLYFACLSNKMGFCSSSMRTDNTSVIFKEIK